MIVDLGSVIETPDEEASADGGDQRYLGAAHQVLSQAGSINQRLINWIAQRHSHSSRTRPPLCYPYMCVYAKRSRRAQALARSTRAAKASE